MARFQMEDGTIVDTKNATESYGEERDWDGHNHIGRSSRSQWHDQTLYRSRKGRYYLVYESRVQGERNHAEWVSHHEAARWLLYNEHALPEELEKFAEEVME